MENPFGDIMQQAKKVQEQMQKVQEEMVNLKVTGEAGAGMVKVTMNGRHDVAGVEIDPDLLKEPVIVLQDLMAAAINDAVQKVEEHNKDKVSGLANGFGNMPFDISKMFQQ